MHDPCEREVHSRMPPRIILGSCLTRASVGAIARASPPPIILTSTV